MADAATSTLSSKGQVVIPEEIRARLGLKTGAQFVVVGDRDVVILKLLEPRAFVDGPLASRNHSRQLLLTQRPTYCKLDGPSCGRS